MKSGFLGLTAGLMLFQPASAQQTTAVLELFTSQGCSSCPPADALIEELAKEQGVLALTLPVDYWDYLGWKDTLASPRFTARQRAYALDRGDARVYTPQVVVNGLTHAVGSDRRGISRATEKSLSRNDVMIVPVSVGEGPSGYTVSVSPAEKPTREGSVWLVPVTRSQTVSIGRGENTGRTVTYTNIARDLIRLGAWSNQSVTFTVPVPTAKPRGTDGFIILVQADSPNGQPGAVLGATKAGGL